MPHTRATTLRPLHDSEINEYVDLMQAGIIDPTKVERVALEHAASIASLLLTPEVLVVDRAAV